MPRKKKPVYTKHCGRVREEIWPTPEEHDERGFLTKTAGSKMVQAPCQSFIPDDQDRCDSCIRAQYDLGWGTNDQCRDPLGFETLYEEDQVTAALRRAEVLPSVLDRLLEQVLRGDDEGYVECPFCSARGYGWIEPQGCDVHDDQVFEDAPWAPGDFNQRHRRQGHFHEVGCPMPALDAKRKADPQYINHFNLKEAK